MTTAQHEQPLLALPGPRWSLNNDMLVVNNKHIYLKQFTSQDDTSTTLWDASFVLLKYFEKHRSEHGSWINQSSSVVLELGSGTGLLGIGLSLLSPHFSHVILSDRGDCLDNLRHNVLENGRLHSDQITKMSVSDVNWMEVDESVERLKQTVTNLSDIDTIVLADCVWVASLVDPLVKTIKRLLQETKARVYVCNELRSQRIQDMFLNSFIADDLFTVETVPVQDMDSVFHSDKIFIYTISKAK